MRHRIVHGTGFGNPDPEILDNHGPKPPKDLAEKVIELYFKDTEGFDYAWGKNTLRIGIEPAYQFDPLKVITIHKTKKKSTITTGHAFGCYGSGIRSKTKTYSEYKYKSKFVKFIDEAHLRLFGK